MEQSDLDFLMSSIAYENTSEAPTGGVRTFAFTAEDSGGLISNTATSAITVKGVNDAPMIEPDSGTVDEDFTGTITDSLTYSDVDDAQSSLTVTTLTNQNGDNGYGVFNVDSSGNWSYDLTETDLAVQALLPGETLTDTVTVTVSDDDGATDTDVITITITGANDAPLISVDADGNNSPNEGVVVPLIGGGQSTVFDGSNGETGQASSLWGPYTDANGLQASYQIGANYTGAYSNIQFDAGGGPDFNFETRLIDNGDNPELEPDAYQTAISFQPEEGVVLESIVVDHDNFQLDPGTLTLTWTGEGPGVVNDPNGVFTNVSDGSLIYSGQTLTIGTSVAPADPWSIEIFDDNVSVGYTTSSPGGASGDESIQITPNLLAAEYADEFTANGSPVNVTDIDPDVDDINENDIVEVEIVTDPSRIDDGSSEQVSLGGQIFDLSTNSGPVTVLAGGVGGTSVDISYNAVTGTFTIVNNAGATVIMPEGDLDALLATMTYENTSLTPSPGVRTFEFTATDSGGLTSNVATSAIEVFVPEATHTHPDCIHVIESKGAAIDVVQNDDDIEEDQLIVVGIDGNAVTTAGQPITLASGASVVVLGDGTVYFDPMGQYDSLDKEETAVETFTYTVSDGVGGTSTETVTVMITGEPDAGATGAFQVANGQLYSIEFDPATESFVNQPVGPNPANVGNYNALSYNNEDDFLYGIIGRNLLKIESRHRCGYHRSCQPVPCGQP